MNLLLIKTHFILPLLYDYRTYNVRIVDRQVINKALRFCCCFNKIYI